MFAAAARARRSADEAVDDQRQDRVGDVYVVHLGQIGPCLDEFDALICPTMAVPALPAEYDVGDEITVNGRPSANWMDVMMTLPFNIASRCPVLSVPSGLSRDGVPTGISIVGKTYDDVTAFRVAAAHERAFPWFDHQSRRPPL